MTCTWCAALPGLGGACDSRSRAGASCPHPSASGEDTNLESRKDCPHRRGRIDCRSKASQTRCRGLERGCTVVVGKPGCASAWNTNRATRARGGLLGEEIFGT